MSKPEGKSIVREGAEIKTGLQTERTWFKWLFTGLQIGGFGTWLLKFSRGGEGTLLLVVIAWMVALSVVLLGLERFYARRNAIHTGATDTAEFDSPKSIIFVVAASTIVIGGTLVYTVISEGAYNVHFVPAHVDPVE